MYYQVTVSILTFSNDNNLYRFEHPKERVNLGKRKVMGDMKEELTDIVSEKMQQLHLSAKIQHFTEH